MHITFLLQVLKVSKQQSTKRCLLPPQTCHRACGPGWTLHDLMQSFHIQVAERGLKFVGVLGELLTDAGLPQNFREAWAFSACLALAVQLAHTAPVSAAGMQPALMPTTSDARCSGASSPSCSSMLASRKDGHFPHSSQLCKPGTLGLIKVCCHRECMGSIHNRDLIKQWLPVWLQQPAQFCKDSCRADGPAHRQVPERW